jgi:hypothetical protein
MQEKITVYVGNKSFEKLEQFTHLGTTLTNQNSGHEGIKSRLKLGNASYPLAQNLLSFMLLSKNIKTVVYRTVIFLVVLYGCVAWSLTQRVEHMLRVFENRMLKKIFGPKGDRVLGEWGRLHNEGLGDICSTTSIIWVTKS